VPTSKHDNCNASSSDHPGMTAESIRQSRGDANGQWRKLRHALATDRF
jgi:hypothetical protein